MPNNRATKEIDQKSFLAFAFKGKTPPETGLPLTMHEQKVYELTKKGLTYKEVAKERGFTIGTVYDSVGKIRGKGWLI